MTSTTHGVIVDGSGRALVWIDGAVYDLNELTPDYSPFLSSAQAIEGHGVIACHSEGCAALQIPNP